MGAHMKLPSQKRHRQTIPEHHNEIDSLRITLLSCQNNPTESLFILLREKCPKKMSTCFPGAEMEWTLLCFKTSIATSEQQQNQNHLMQLFLTIEATDNHWNKLSKAKSIRKGTVQMQLR